MLYDAQGNLDLKELQVVAATSLLQRSLDNEIALGAANMRLQNITQSLSEELARLRNSDIAGLNATVGELQTKLTIAQNETKEALEQFGTVKQREGKLKESIRGLQESEQAAIDERNELRTKNQELATENEKLKRAQRRRPAPSKTAAKA